MTFAFASDDSLGWTSPAPMHSYDALTLFFEEMRVGGILDGLQLVSIQSADTPGYPHGHALKFYQPTTRRMLRFNTSAYVNQQKQIDIDDEPLSYADAITRLRALMASAVKWSKPAHETTRALTR
jgi:hypothetical protein